MKTYFKLFVVYSFSLLSGCIPVEDINRLWEVAGSDDSLMGVWSLESSREQECSELQYRVDVNSTNMTCLALTSYNGTNKTSQPAFCRSIIDNKMDVRYLIVSNPYRLVFDDEAPLTPFSIVLPYQVTKNGNLLVFQVVNEKLLLLVEGKMVCGKLVREEAGAHERIQPVVTNPSLEDLRIIFRDAVNTNEFSCFFKDARGIGESRQGRNKGQEKQGARIQKLD